MYDMPDTQATSNAPGNVSLVKGLVDHPAFNITNPNNCYSLFLGFGRSPINFHAADGSGYAFLGDAVLRVDGINHQVRHCCCARALLTASLRPISYRRTQSCGCARGCGRCRSMRVP
jgi:aminopeptidase N